ncbi:sodium channel and clathrin linker 1-like [Cylas formicarius]|uniref:sodium channel and clathrin linker 1-like n=1 Tax=Cylas formicarius TaxID=197179 RepID=UPI00295891F1|nr:sodium channel and clathrin linker 1-like [Cylas formicarius]
MEEQFEIGPKCFEDVDENYEELINELRSELIEIKKDHEKLKTNLITVTSENNYLTQELHNVLISKPGRIEENAELINNLKEQISLSIAEKEHFSKLWQNSVQMIDHLEGELKVFQAGTEDFLPKQQVKKLKVAYEDKIRVLEQNLSSTQKKLEESVQQVTSELGAKHSVIDQSLENQAGAFKIVKNLESEILKLQNRLKESTQENVQLEKIILNKENVIQGLKRKSSECWAKVTEAVNIVEAALNEKDAALFREREIAEENQKMVEQITEITKKYEERIKNETGIIKDECNRKLKELTEELAQTQNEVKRKSLEIENQAKNVILLEHEVQRLQAGNLSFNESNTSKLLVLEKNLEATFQKLLVSEKQNIQLISERDCIKGDLEQMAGLYERTLRAKEIEIATLKNKITQLQTELDTNSSQLVNVTEKMSQLNNKIEATEKELRKQKENFEESVKQQYNAKIIEINKEYKDNIEELQSQISIKDQINKKWRTETKGIIDNLEKIITNLKTETHQVKRDNGKLKEKLKKSEEKINQYKVFLELISNDVNKISVLTVDQESRN